MLGALVLTALISSFINALGFIAAKPIYEIVADSIFFDIEKHLGMCDCCEDMTEKARNGEYHDFFMRDDKIEKLTDILSLGAKGNPCIVGSRGVGKTALVEGLAYRIAHGNVPENMKNKKIFKINLYKLIVDTVNLKSSPLKRLRAVLDKAKEDESIILFIKDIYQIYKIPGAPELIKMYLDDTDIKIIATATDEEYAAMLKYDGFSKDDYTYIFMDEPSKFDTFRILKYLTNDIEKEKDMRISDEVLMDILNLTGRYMKNKCYPNKAVDILNLALVSARKKSRNDEICDVEHQDVVEAISQVANMRIGDLSEDEIEALETMNERVKKLVVGQENAVDSVCAALKRGRLGLCDENKPRASFLFVGPSGVGKSKLARVVGEEIGSFIDIDMLILGNKHSLESLIGSGKSKSELIEQITKNPYSVVMFDNIDSADDAEMSVIYEILDRGFLTDFSGKRGDFTNAIVILSADSGDKFTNSKDKQGVLKEFLSEKFSGKIGNGVIKKVTDVIFFNSLSKENYGSIARTKISELESRLHGFGINVKISDGVIEYICNICFERENSYGAGAIDRVIRENIELPISDLMMKKKLKSDGQVFCVLENGEIKFDMGERL